MGAFLIKQLFHSRLLDMRLVIANSYPTRAYGIIVKYHMEIQLAELHSYYFNVLILARVSSDLVQHDKDTIC